MPKRGLTERKVWTKLTPDGDDGHSSAEETGELGAFTHAASKLLKLRREHQEAVCREADLRQMLANAQAEYEAARARLDELLGDGQGVANTPRYKTSRTWRGKPAAVETSAPEAMPDRGAAAAVAVVEEPMEAEVLEVA